MWNVELPTNVDMISNRQRFAFWRFDGATDLIVTYFVNDGDSRIDLSSRRSHERPVRVSNNDKGLCLVERIKLDRILVRVPAVVEPVPDLTRVLRRLYECPCAQARSAYSWPAPGGRVTEILDDAGQRRNLGGRADVPRLIRLRPGAYP